MHEHNISGGPSVLDKVESMQVAVPRPPATGASISANNDSALGGEPVALHSMLSQLQPVFLQIRKGFVAYFDIAIPSVGLWEGSIQTGQVKTSKGQSISAGL